MGPTSQGGHCVFHAGTKKRGNQGSYVPQDDIALVGDHALLDGVVALNAHTVEGVGAAVGEHDEPGCAAFNDATKRRKRRSLKRPIT